MRLHDGRAVPAFMSQALRGEDITIFGNGQQTRSFCYVTDLVDGIIRLMDSDVNEPVNIGNPHEMTIEEIARRHPAPDRIEEQARLSAAARRRSEGATAGHHPGADAARVGAEGRARRGAAEDAGVFPEEGLSDPSLKHLATARTSGASEPGRAAQGMGPCKRASRGAPGGEAPRTRLVPELDYLKPVMQR